jgi:hypothetical protein
MPGSRINRARQAGRKGVPPQHVFLAAVPSMLALLSLSGLRGLGGLYLSPAVSFALGVAALALAMQVRRSGRDIQLLCEIGIALAVTACAAGALAALVTGHS